MSTKVKDVRLVLVRSAGEEALLDGSESIEAEHVLLALAKLFGSTASRLLTEVGLTRDAIRAALDREWEQSLAVAGVAVQVAQSNGRWTTHQRPAVGGSAPAVSPGLPKRRTDRDLGAGPDRCGDVRDRSGEWLSAAGFIVAFLLAGTGFSQTEPWVDVAGLFQRISAIIGWKWTFARTRGAGGKPAQ
jgi:hypothetical protein